MINEIHALSVRKSAIGVNVVYGKQLSYTKETVMAVWESGCKQIGRPVSNGKVREV